MRINKCSLSFVKTTTSEQKSKTEKQKNPVTSISPKDLQIQGFEEKI